MTKLCDKILQCLPDSPIIPLPQPEHYDSVHLATELGRLDLVTVLLAALTVMVAGAALVGFGYFRGLTINIAKVEAKKAAKETVEEQLKPILQKMDEQIKRLGDLSAITRTTAPEVANATEARENNENAV